MALHRATFVAVASLFVASSAEAANHTVTLTAAQTFEPQVATIRVGDTVTWVNPVGAGAHNVQSDNMTFSSGSAALGPWTFSVTFTTTGTFGYHCQPHGSPAAGQFGTIVVIDAFEITHGSEIVEDLAGAPDRYRLGQRPYASYEVVVDPMAGNPQLGLERTDAAGMVVQPGVPVTTAIDHSQSLRWENASGTALDTQRVRVTSGNCPGACSANEHYRLRSYETTYAVPRFNNSGTQVTVLLMQNPADYGVSGTIYFWDAAGALINSGGHAINLAPRASLVLVTGTVANVAGKAGTITITHTARYGDLAAKAVALEPATGFSFDTPAVWRPR